MIKEKMVKAENFKIRRRKFYLKLADFKKFVDN